MWSAMTICIGGHPVENHDERMCIETIDNLGKGPPGRASSGPESQFDGRDEVEDHRDSGQTLPAGVQRNNCGHPGGRC